MRDAERMKERVELRLDDRQIAGLAVAALLLLGAVFALGLQTGKTLALRGPRSAPAEPSALDAAQEHAPAALAEPTSPERAVDPPPPAARAPAAEAERTTPPVTRAASPVVAPQREAAVPPPPPAAVVPPPVVQTVPGPPEHVGRFTVQIGASQERAEAARLVARARGAGLKPYVVEAKLGARGTWYRVRVGAFDAKDAAAKFRQDVERELHARAVVMPTR